MSSQVPRCQTGAPDVPRFRLIRRADVDLKTCTMRPSEPGAVPFGRPTVPACLSRSIPPSIHIYRGVGRAGVVGEADQRDDPVDVIRHDDERVQPDPAEMPGKPALRAAHHSPTRIFPHHAVDHLPEGNC